MSGKLMRLSMRHPGTLPAIAAMLLLTLVPRAQSAQAKPAPAQAAPAVSPNEEVLKLVQSGLPESVVINKIHTLTGKFDTSAEALIALQRGGATEAELAAITAPPPPPPPPPPP